MGALEGCGQRRGRDLTQVLTGALLPLQELGTRVGATALVQVSSVGAGPDGGREGGEVGGFWRDLFLAEPVDWPSSGCRVGLRGIKDNS